MMARESSLLALSIFALSACATERSELPTEVHDDLASGVMLNSFANSEWPEPVHLDAPINSPARELAAHLSPDELSLYFGSDRDGGFGGIDIWVSRRACLDCPWGEPLNLGPDFNSAGGDGQPALSRDGHLLFFSGARGGGEGGEDIWVAHRTDTNDDFGWGPPVNLGPAVNTANDERSPAYVQALEGAGGNLYFTRGFDIYQTRVTRNGEVVAEVAAVAELNTTDIEEGVSIRADGLEAFFWSTRPGGAGGADIWVATRQSPNHAWSEPVPVAALNTTRADLEPTLSWDGRTLLFSVAATARPSLGFQDIWMSTRTPSGR